MSTVKFDTWQNSDGTAEFYKCRAWVNFNGTGTVAIRAAGNVSSITDNAANDYTVNFTTAMPDVNYVVAGTASSSTFVSTSAAVSLNVNGGVVGQLTTSVRVISQAGAATDRDTMSVAIFR